MTIFSSENPKWLFLAKGNKPFPVTVKSAFCLRPVGSKKKGSITSFTIKRTSHPQLSTIVTVCACNKKGGTWPGDPSASKAIRRHELETHCECLARLGCKNNGNPLT